MAALPALGGDAPSDGDLQPEAVMGVAVRLGGL